MRRFGIGHVIAPMDKSFFDPQRIQGLATNQTQAKCLPRLEKNFKNMLSKVRRDKNFPT